MTDYYREVLDLRATNQNLAARLRRVESRALDLSRKVRIGKKRTHIALVGLVARLQISEMKSRAQQLRQQEFIRFADDLNAARLQRGLTFSDLAAKSALPAERVMAVCHGDWTCELKDVVAVCMALRVMANMKIVPIGGGPVQVIPIGPDGKQR